MYFKETEGKAKKPGQFLYNNIFRMNSLFQTGFLINEEN